MAETSKNKIYYNDNENSVADVLTDMKKMAESTDEAIEKSKYNDAAIKKSISDVEKKQVEKNTEQDSKIVELQTEKAKLETELKEMQEDFYQNSIRGQASGEYIHVEDSSNCRAKIGIGGNSEQETRNGKNILELMEGTYSNNGITAVVKDGVITLNGTATAISFVGINLLKSLELTNNKTYHLSAFNEKTAGDSTNYCSLRINQDNIQVLFNKTNANGSITTNLKISYITIRTQTGITYNNFVVKPQLELGAGTNEWEQGGVSPSPDYQSPVKTVGSNVNLSDKDNTNIKNWYIDTSNKKIASGNSENRILIQEIKPNTTYTISKKLSTFIVATCTNMPTLNSLTTQAQRNDNATKITIASGSSDKYLVVQFKTQADTLTEQEILDSIKIVEGTEVGEYSKYSQGSVKVTKCNKNLANIEKFNIAGGTGTTYPKTIQGLKENTEYTISFYKSRIVGATISNTSIHGCRQMHFYHNEEKLSEYTYNSPVSGFSSGNKKFKIKITTPAKCNKVICYFDNANGDNNINTTVYDIQLEEGTATDYEEHEEQSYIMPTQSEMLEGDYFDFDNEEEVHTWNKLVLNGTEEFNSWTGNAPSGYKVFYSRILTNAINSQGDLKCNALKYIENPWESGKNAIGLQRIFKEVYISIESKYASTLEEFKTYLKSQHDAGTPVVIYYKLATPTKLAFTEEQKAVAKELNNARTYKNVTNITTDSIAILDLDYAKDLETLITSNQKVEEV